MNELHLLELRDIQKGGVGMKKEENDQMEKDLELARKWSRQANVISLAALIINIIGLIVRIIIK